MTKSPVISVIIPTFNRSKLLLAAIDSCLRQTYTGGIEIIVVDDGSTDGTADQLRRSGLLSRIQYIHQDNAGVCRARNRGLSQARGHYIQFLDSDDILHPDKFRLQARELERVAESEMCICLTGSIRDEGPIEGELTTGRIEEAGDLASSMLQDHLITNLSPIYKASLCREIGLWNTDLSNFEDWEYNFRAVLFARRVVVVKQVLAYVRFHSGVRLSEAAESAVLPAMEKYLSSVEAVLQVKGERGGQLCNVLARRWLVLGIREVRAGQVAVGMKHIEHSCGISNDAIWRVKIRVLAGCLQCIGPHRVVRVYDRIAGVVRRYKGR